MSQNASQWVYEEAALRLIKPLFDAEIRLGREVLTAEPLGKLAPVPVQARIGNLSTEFAIVRRNVRHEVGPRQERFDHIWHCIDYNRMRFRDGRTGLDVSASELAPELWSAIDRAFTEGLQTFWYLAPRSDIGNLFHFIGRRSAGAWHPARFQSIGFGTWYPKSWEQIRRHTTEDAPAAEGWRFAPLPAPRLVNAAGDSLTHDGIANDPDFDPDTTPHHFVYEGKLGRYRIPVAFRLLQSGVPSPRKWSVDCCTPFEIRRGHARDRRYPALPGAARLSESEWAELEETLISAFLNWPRTPATGYRPLWIEFDRGYHEGAWGTRLLVVGSNNAITGLPGVPE